MNIGKRVKQIMNEKGISQNELARKANLSSSGISTALNENGNPRIDTLIAVSSALGCPLSDLFVESTDDSEPLLTEYDRQLITYARRLNAQGMDKLLDYARDLTENERYTKEKYTRKAE